MSAKKQLEFSARSIVNMGAIKQHIATDNPVAASRVIDAVFAAADELLHFPMIGRAGRRSGTRELVLPHYPYTLIYRLTEIKVLIVAVVHQSRKNF